MIPQALAAELVLPAQDLLGECPVYDREAQQLWWVDIRRMLLRRCTPLGEDLESWTAPGLCCGVALAPGRAVVAVDRALWWFDPEVGFSLMTVFPDEPPSNRLNEMRVAPDGSLWVGSMVDFARSIGGRLYRIGTSNQPRLQLEDVGVPNSLAWSPEGRWMYFADTLDGRILRYPVEGERLGPPQLFVERGVLPGKADGCAVDAEGGLWSARLGAGCVVRVSAGGVPTHRIDLPPGAEPTACTFAGSRLFITTARQAVADPSLREGPNAGGLFVVETQAMGTPGRRFAPSHPPTGAASS